MTDCEMSDIRIEAILGEDNLNVSTDSLIMYTSYLEENIVLPCILTGIQSFSWEDFYVLGLGDKKQYEELKKTRPSSRDIYKFMSFDDMIDDDDGLLVKVKRISDNKKFVLPLLDLKATDEESPNYLLISDYSFWYVNYRY